MFVPFTLPIIARLANYSENTVILTVISYPCSHYHEHVAESVLEYEIEQSLDGTELQDSQENREHSETKT